MAEAAAEGSALELIDAFTEIVEAAAALVAVGAGEADDTDVGVADAFASKLSGQWPARP